MTQIARLIAAISTLATFSLMTGAAYAQSNATELDASARSEIVGTAAALLRSRYVFPDAGESAAAHIEGELASGAYSAFSSPGKFADRLTADLQTITHDKHMRAFEPRSRDRAAQADRPPEEGGITRADLLPGNVGYIELIGFPALTAFRPAIDRAMESLSGVSALVIDLRRNGGGDPESVSYLVSHFLDSAQPVHVNDFVKRIQDTEEFEVEEFWSSPTATSMHSRTVYVLTSNRTFSAAEEFAYDMKVMKLGATIGETTGGGANPGATQEIGSSLVLFVPDGRARNPVTQTNWEGVGVSADIEVPAQDALKAALAQREYMARTGDIDTLSLVRLFEPGN